jgi:hypothetical protein
MSISSRSTKAEILAAYQELKAHPTTLQDVIAWGTAQTQAVAREVPLFIKDCHKLALWCRRQYDVVVGELSRPLLKS